MFDNINYFTLFFFHFCLLFKKKIFTGETSSGKSTLINKILGINLFKGRLLESTSTICKIRNSGQIKIITTKVTGEIKEKIFSDTCNLLNKECVREIRRYLKERTDLTQMQLDITADFQTVDIGLPVPFLKVAMLVLVAVYLKFQNTMHVGVHFFFT